MLFFAPDKIWNATVNILAPIPIIGVILFLSSCAHPPPPMMPSHNPKSAVEICAGGECGVAGEMFALDDVAEAIASMFKVNGPGAWKFCAANRDNRQCVQNQLSYTVNGPLPATGYVPGGALRANAKYDGKRGVSFRVNIPTIVFDTASVCDDAHSTLSVRSSKSIVWQSNVYMCSWGGGPMTIKAEGQYGIDFIDFDRGVMGGEFAIRVSEGGNGFTRGYAVTRLSIGMEEVEQAWLRSRKQLAAAQAVISSNQPVLTAPQAPPGSTAKKFWERPVDVTFKKGISRPDDIAVIIGNADYSSLGKDIPDVMPAYADAAGIKRYVIDSLGIREGNIIDLRDASGSEMVEVFGSERDHRGQLFDWVKSGISRVFIYYAGHGAPAENDGQALLVPADANAARIELSGYPLSTLYANLGKIPAKSVTVVLEACFSGVSENGPVISNASPVYLKAKSTIVPGNITVIAAGGPDQMASWEQDKNHGLFTKYFLKGMSGEADSNPYGNNDGTVNLKELKGYLDGTMTYLARRYYGRDQNVHIVGAN